MGSDLKPADPSVSWPGPLQRGAAAGRGAALAPQEEAGGEGHVGT